METKEHQRYILFKIFAKEKIEQDEFIRALWRQIFQLYGESGTSQTGLWLSEYEYEKSYGIIRTNVMALPIVRTTMATIRKIDGKDCLLAIQGVSGTIKALKEKHLFKISANSQ